MDGKPYRALGARLHALRLRQRPDLNDQAKAAAAYGVTRNTVGNWERGEVQIPETKKQRIARVLNVDVRDLYAGRDDPLWRELMGGGGG
jgi:transcriptional regulator with XRE-family HTH domain